MKKIWCFDLWNTLIKSMNGSMLTYEDMLVNLGVKREMIFPFVRDYCMTKKMSNLGFASYICNNFGLTDLKVHCDVVLALQCENENAEWIGHACQVLNAIRSRGDSVVLITNSTYMGWMQANKKLCVSDYFSHTYLSWEQRCSKPKTDVFIKVMSWFPDHNPDQFIMIGDSVESDIEIPKKLGWNTVYTTGGIDNVLECKN